MTDEELLNIGKRIYEFADKFDIPLKYLFDILEDQKVTPMIRGKAMEYNAFIVLDSILPRNTWSVQKLNLNAQPGSVDEDISITHRRSGAILKVESKSCVRESFTDGKRARKIKEPHFKVKCHRSRSNIKLAGTSNDRYSVDTFDIIVTNPLNSIYKGNTISEELELIDNAEFKNILFQHYNVKDEKTLLKAISADWRFVIPPKIAERGYIPRTPYVKLKNDPNWRPLKELENELLAVVIEKRSAKSRRY